MRSTTGDRQTRRACCPDGRAICNTAGASPSCLCYYIASTDCYLHRQSLEIRDQNGKPVGQGSHEKPEEVTEYYVFQRDMWRPLVEEDWTLVKRGAKETDLIANPEDQA